MPREQRGNRFDAVQRALFETPRAKLLFHSPADRIPGFLVDFGADAAVSDDLDAPVDELNVDQNPAVLLGIPDAELREHLPRALPGPEALPQRQPVQTGLHREPQFSIVRLLRIPDR